MKNTKKKGFWVIGKNYLIRTVTMIQTGKLESIDDKEIILSHAAWIADTGRFTEAVKSQSFSEVELFPTDKLIAVGRGALIDAVEIETLPNKQI